MNHNDADQPFAPLRALAHPIRLQILSLITGYPLSAAELAREFDMNHSAISYHLRQLEAAKLIEVAEVRRTRGQEERRYKRIADPSDVRDDQVDIDDWLLLVEAVCAGLRRRAIIAAPGHRWVEDIELWVDEATWNQAKRQVEDALRFLRDGALARHSPGTVPVSAMTALFRLRDSPS